MRIRLPNCRTAMPKREAVDGHANHVAGKSFGRTPAWHSIPSQVCKTRRLDSYGTPASFDLRRRGWEDNIQHINPAPRFSFFLVGPHNLDTSKRRRHAPTSTGREHVLRRRPPLSHISSQLSQVLLLSAVIRRKFHRRPGLQQPIQSRPKPRRAHSALFVQRRGWF